MMRRPLALVIGLAVGLGAAAASGVFASDTTSPSSGSNSPRSYSTELPNTPLLPQPGDGGIFYGGAQTSLAEAEGQLEFIFYRPNDALASDESIVRVWTETQNLDGEPSVTRAAVLYVSGVLLKVELESIGRPRQEAPCVDNECDVHDDPASSFQELARRLADQLATAEFPASSFLGTAKGGTALYTPYLGGESPGSVMFSYQGVRITIFGKLERDSLSRLAESIS